MKNKSFERISANNKSTKNRHHESGDVILKHVADEQRILLELQRTKRENDLLFDSAPIPMWIMDIHSGRILRVNFAACELYGFSQAEFLTLDCAEAICPTLKSCLSEVKQLPLSHGGLNSKKVTTRSFKKDGTEIIVEASFIRTIYQGLECVYTALQDISESLRGKELLRQSEEHYRLVTELLPQSIWTAGPDGQMTYANQHWYEYTGLTEAQTLANEWIQFTHPDDQKRAWEQWHEAVRTKQKIAIELRFKRKDGEYRWQYAAAGPMKNDKGEVTQWTGIIIDIHDKRLAEERMRASEERLTLATDAGRIAIWEWDIANNKVDSSPLHRKLFHFDENQTHVTDEMIFSQIHLDDRPKVVERLHESLSKGTEYMDEFRVIDSETRWLFGRGRPVFNEDGTPKRMYGVNIDITERKKTDAQLKAAKEDAERANRTKSAFLANMSHEIRTPLGAILGFTELLKDPHLDEKDRAAYLSVISRNGDQLKTIINDILDLSKIEAGQISIETLKVSPRTVIEEVLDLFSVHAREKGLVLKGKFNSDLPDWIGTDPTRLKQIIINLVGNAIKFTQSGEVLVEAFYKPSADDKAQFIVDVTDTGIGISQDQKPALFKSFSQADEKITRKFGGTGLGLTLSKHFGEALGGSVTLVKSVPHKGSQFRVTIEDRISTSKDQPQVNSSLSQLNHDDLNGIRVLLVEDSPDNQNLIWRILSKRNAAVAIANDGFEAISKALSDDFDVILMDVQMPVLDGYSATVQLREKGFKKPIIALTAHAMSQARQQCFEVGCTDFLSKPIDSKKLIGLVSKYGHRDSSPAIKRSKEIRA